MVRPLKTLVSLVLAGTASVFAWGRQASQNHSDPAAPMVEPFRGALANLKSHPIQVGCLLLSMAPRSLAVGPAGGFELRAQNTANRAAEFNPWNFAFVNSDGQQIDYFLMDSQQINQIAPKAYIKRTYLLSELKGSFKIYYKDILIAEIHQ